MNSDKIITVIQDLIEERDARYREVMFLKNYIAENNTKKPSI